MTTIEETFLNLAQLLSGTSPGALAPKTTTILSLGGRPDATTWENGCKLLGFQAPNPVKKDFPSLEEIKKSFKSTAHWIYLGGHFTDSLYNEWETVKIYFEADQVRVQIDGQPEAVLRKDTGDLRLHENCEVVLWGGCSVADNMERVKDLFKLFGPHTLIAFRGQTGKHLMNAMLGGDWMTRRPRRHFFHRVRDKVNDPAGIRNAWLETARYGYDGTELIHRFRVFDPDGQEWKIVNSQIVKGHKIDLAR